MFELRSIFKKLNDAFEAFALKCSMVFGADINQVDEHGNTLLAYAVGSGNLYLVKVLLENGAYTNLPDEFGNTPLVNAIIAGDLEIAKLLVSWGANIDFFKEPSKPFVSNTNTADNMKGLELQPLHEPLEPNILVDNQTASTLFTSGM